MIGKATTYSPESPVAPREAQGWLLEAVTEALAAPNGNDTPRVIRVEVPVEGVDLLAWLAAQHDALRLYWGGRRDGMAVAAVGQADACRGEGVAFQRLLAERMEALPAGGRYYGGIRFDADRPADEAWQAFGGFAFFLPRFEVRREGTYTTLACNLLLPADHDRLPAIRSAIEGLRFPATGSALRLPLPAGREDLPDRAGWEANVRWALDAFEAGGLEKVVLARRATFRFDAPLEPVSLLRALEAATPNCFHYLFQPEDGVAFVGATPERLFRRVGRSIESEAVAGTRPRGATARADERLREELLHSEKDLREHAYVRESIRQTLAPLCERLEVDESASEMPLAQGRHLVTRFHGTLRPDVDTLALLSGLHPTPAVGGYPREMALEAIRHLEPFDRGWYAGPVGWMGPHDAEFAVALRCGLIQHDRVSLYSGAGIVAGSTPEAEWAEIEHKIVDFIKVLGLDLRRAK